MWGLTWGVRWGVTWGLIWGLETLKWLIIKEIRRKTGGLGRRLIISNSQFTINVTTQHPSFTTNKNLQKSNNNDDPVQIPVQFFIRLLKIFEDFCLHAMGCWAVTN